MNEKESVYARVNDHHRHQADKVVVVVQGSGSSDSVFTTDSIIQHSQGYHLVVSLVLLTFVLQMKQKGMSQQGALQSRGRQTRQRTPRKGRGVDRCRDPDKLHIDPVRQTGKQFERALDI